LILRQEKASGFSKHRNFAVNPTDRAVYLIARHSNRTWFADPQPSQDKSQGEVQQAMAVVRDRLDPLP
jgi:hypothetical protein